MNAVIKIYFFFYLEKKDRAGCGGSQMNRNTNDFRDVEILLHTHRIFVPNSTKHIFRRSGFTLEVTPDFYNLFFYYILSYMIYTKYIIICVIIYFFSLRTEFYTVHR